MRTAFGLEFDVPDGYLNTASIGIPPTPAADAVAAAITGWRTGTGRPPEFDEPVAIGRAAFARLVGVTAERVAIGTTVSGLLGIVAESIPAGSRVLVARGDFTSATWPFAAQAHRGVTVDEVDLAELPERAPHYDLVAVSVVQSADGRIVDLEALRAARAAGTRVVLDATQSVGWFDADLSWADAVACAAYKWLLTPRGVAWLAVHPEFTIASSQAGWYAAAEPWNGVYGLPLRLAPDARALDISPAWYSHVGAGAVLPLLAGLDRAAVQSHCAGLADAVRTGLRMEPAGSAIVSIKLPDAAERLRAAGVVASTRAGAARIGFHLYNNESDVEQVLKALP